MTISTMLYKLILGPLLLLFDGIFKLAYRSVSQNPGVLIVFLSLAMNLLVLPLYRRADAIQEADRVQSMKLQPGIRHIRRTFRGNERFMMLQTYYRQNDYKPWYALKGSLSLLLEIPFFIAAYRFLSGLQLIQGVGFGPIRDLGAPDGLLHIAGRAVNLLPVLMTGINIVSGAIYTRGMPARAKIQLYGMALVFLVFLYDSPSGLVFYWTLNNVFSLVKNIFYRLRDPKRALVRLCAVLGLLMLAALAILRGSLNKAHMLFLGVGGGALLLPLLARFALRRHPIRVELRETKGDRRVFTACCAFLTLLLGVLIPLDLLKSSPAEFIDIASYRSSLWYVLSSALLAAGAFLVWFGIFYRLCGQAARKAFSVAVAALSAVAVLDYTCFGGDYGTMSPELQYESHLVISRSQYLLNTALVLALAGAVWLVWRQRQGLLRVVSVAACVAVTAMSVAGGISVERSNRALLATLDADAIGQRVSFPLDRTGKNVVVVMLDRAIGRLVPYLMAEKPELKDMFDGFTFYPNTLSYGTHTNIGAPALFGGYEYTPLEMNRRDREPLADKHDEALKVMPVLFLENGYDVTVCDPPYAGYGEVPDLSVYDEWPRIRTYITMTGNAIDDDSLKESTDALRHRNFFCYGLFRAAPLLLHKVLYDKGQYNEMDTVWTQICHGVSVARGLNYAFMKSYGVLSRLPESTEVRNTGRGTFMMIDNETTHSQMILREPDYVPVLAVDNRQYDAAHADRPGMDGDEIRLETLRQMQHYHINMAALLKLGAWMEYLRAEGVYDNTRIIIVSDHGAGLNGLFGMRLSKRKDMLQFNPLLMVKDFDSRGFTVDDAFMTNADTPLLALSGLVADPVNPFTGRPLTDAAKRAPEQQVASVKDYHPSSNNGTRFNTSSWFANQNRVDDLSAWREIGPEPEGGAVERNYF